jgi:hypothetical protein
LLEAGEILYEIRPTGRMKGPTIRALKFGAMISSRFFQYDWGLALSGEIV